VRVRFEYLLLLVDLFHALLRSRSDLTAENLLLRQQLAVLARPTRKRPRLHARDKFFWLLIRALRRDWPAHLVLVRPETVVRWDRGAWKRFWRWRSRGRLGRPRLSAEIRQLIARIARENPSWGSERIRGELLKLRIAVSKHSVQQYPGRGPARPPSQTWRIFLANHRPHLWAADLFTVQTLTFRTLYVLLFITHGRRELVHLNVTTHPTAAWVWRQLIEATPWGRQPRYLLRDRDAVYGGEFSERARRLGIRTLLSPVRAPARTRSRSGSCARSGASASTDWSSSTSDTSGRSSPSSSRTTTRTFRIGAWRWIPRGPPPVPPPARSARGSCSAVCITSTRVRADRPALPRSGKAPHHVYARAG